MIHLMRKCPDCGENINSTIQFDTRCVPFWECPKCGVVHEDYNWFRTLKSKAAYDALMYSKKPEGLFIYDTDIELIAIKNIGGEMQVGEFPAYLEALLWLAGRVA